jgi:hypothetical protein
MSRKRTQKELGNLMADPDSQAAGFFQADHPQAPARAARVVEIPVSQCRPDRFQARIILPADLKSQYFAGELDCFDTARSLIAAAQYDAGLQAQVEALSILGENIMELGQIEPITGSWVQGANRELYFAIEVGERRFWSLVLMTVIHNPPSEPTIRAIEESQFNRERQIAENVQREGNTAVDLARAAAGLILLRLDRHPDPHLEDDWDYFRQVLAITRLPNGTWLPIERLLKRSRPVLERHLQLLQLPGELLYMAKLYNIPEGRLREVLAAPASQRRNLLLLALEEDMTARELRETVSNLPVKTIRSGISLSSHKKAAGRLRAFLKLARRQDFAQNYEAVAVECSIASVSAEDLLETAEHLENQAAWLREMYTRRK